MAETTGAQRAKHPWHRRQGFRIAVLALLGMFLLWWCRYPLLRALGNHLITEDTPAHVDAVFVLGGSVLDRGVEAARVYEQGWGDHFVFTGAPIPAPLDALAIDSTEAECTRNSAVLAGVPFGNTKALNVGTSTYEESEALLEYAQANGFDTVMVISSKFHLRRIGRVFKKPFRKAGITVLLHGAPSSVYDEERWWQQEEGLIMVNNEYTKQLYYLIKY